MLLGCSNLCLHFFGGSGSGGGLSVLGVGWRVVDGFLLDVHANELNGGREGEKDKNDQLGENEREEVGGSGGERSTRGRNRAR